MATRTPVERGSVRARVVPIAAPVDTFVRDNAGYGLNQLAEALQSVSPEVAKYSDVKAQQQSETQKAAGEQKARELFEQGKTYRDAIKAGDIAPHESPWFQLGAKEQYGRVTAGRFSSDLHDAIQKDPQLQSSVEVADYDKFFKDFRAQWVEKNVGTENRDLQFEHGFGSLADQMAKDARNQFVEAAGQRLVASQGDNQYQEVFQLVDHELSMNTNPGAIAEAINLANDRAIAMGANPRIANIATVKALGDIVSRDGDVSLFDMLKQVRTGSGNLYSTQWAQEEIQKVTHQVYEDKQRHHVADQAAAEETKKAHTLAETGDIISQWVLSDNPSRLNFDKRIAALALTDPQAAAALKQSQHVIGDANFESDTTVKQTALANIFKPQGDKDYVDVNSLVGLLNQRQINAQDFLTLKSQIDERDNAIRREKDGSHNPYTDPQFSHSMTSLQQQITAGRPEEMWTPEVMRRANGAQAEFGRAWLEYMTGPGQTATYLEKNKFLEETLLAVTSKWQPAITKRGADQPSVPQVDLRTPAMRDQVRRMANLIDAQTRSNTGLSPGVLYFLRSNGITDASAFVKQYADHE